MRSKGYGKIHRYGVPSFFLIKKIKFVESKQKDFQIRKIFEQFWNQKIADSTTANANTLEAPKW